MIEMRRPNWWDFISEVRKSAGIFYYACSCGDTLQTFKELREHWQAGHFDYVVDAAHVLNRLEFEIQKAQQKESTMGWDKGPYTAGLEQALTLIKELRGKLL